MSAFISEMQVPDPVFYWDSPGEDAQESGWKGPGWYFYDETWSYAYGPHKNKEEAHVACQRYCDTLE